MVANVTIARPYAKAVFEYALAEGEITACALLLNQLALALQTPQVKDFMMNPAVNPVDQTALLVSAVSSIRSSGKFPIQNFIQTLAAHKRIAVLPEIYQLYEEMRARHEKIQAVKVVSFSPLTTAQLEKMKQALCKRLNKEISIDLSIDESLIGGAIIYAGDLVINGSVRDKLFKLGADLVA